MPAKIDTLELSEAFKAAGLKGSGEGVARAIQDIAMKDVPSSSDIDKAVHTMSVRFGLMLAAAVAILSAIINLH